jgi:predicted amino acid racemase/sugar lactone lactonase YvrE
MSGPVTLVRTPMLSQVDEVVDLCDTSCNTEREVLVALSAAAQRRDRRHGVVLMVELGDLREGIMPDDLASVARVARDLPNLVLRGIGANLACRSGVVPDAANMAELSALVAVVEHTTGVELEVVSGGNSANLGWALGHGDTGRVNELRLGEALLLGVDPVERRPVDGLRTDALTLVAEVIESGPKPSLPWGTLAQTAFGEHPDALDHGEVVQTIVALGRQDTDTADLTAPPGMTLVASSSDHLVTWTDERPRPAPRSSSAGLAVLRDDSPTVELVVLEERRSGLGRAGALTRTRSRRSGTGRLGTLRGWPSNCPPSTGPSPRDCASPRARRRSRTDRCWWSRSHGARSAACDPTAGSRWSPSAAAGPTARRSVRTARSGSPTTAAASSGSTSGRAGPRWRSPRTGGRIQRVDLDTGVVETVYTHCDGRPLRAPNDLVFDEHGGFWFTDHGVRLERSSDLTGVFYAAADGSSITEVLHPLEAPNGIGLSPAGDRLYVAETHTGRVYAWEVPEPGVATGGGLLAPHGDLLAGLPGLQLLDSLAVDGEGNVCVGTLSNGGLTVISPDGASVQHLPVDDLLVTNVAFGGPGLRTAYVTASATGRLLAFDWPVDGLAAPFRR